MKRLTLLLMLTAELIFFGAITTMAMTGSYSDVAVTEKTVIDAAEFAVEAQAAKMANENSSASGKLELQQILSAQQQVVSGVNYRLEVAVSLDGEQKIAEAVVWWQSWREPEPYILTSWSWIE